MENATENSNSTVTLKISELEPNQDQPRREFDDEAWRSWRILSPSTECSSPCW